MDCHYTVIKYIFSFVALNLVLLFCWIYQFSILAIYIHYYFTFMLGFYSV